MKDCLKQILFERFGIEVEFSYMDFDCTMIYVDDNQFIVDIVKDVLVSLGIQIYQVPEVTGREDRMVVFCVEVIE